MGAVSDQRIEKEKGKKQFDLAFEIKRNYLE